MFMNIWIFIYEYMNMVIWILEHWVQFINSAWNRHGPWRKTVRDPSQGIPKHYNHPDITETHSMRCEVGRDTKLYKYSQFPKDPGAKSGASYVTEI